MDSRKKSFKKRWMTQKAVITVSTYVAVSNLTPLAILMIFWTKNTSNLAVKANMIIHAKEKLYP